VWANFVIFYVNFGFYDYCLCNFIYFLFCFLVDVRFQAHLRFCKPPKKVDFLSIIFKKNKTINLEFTSATPFAHQTSVFCVFLLSLAFVSIISMHIVHLSFSY
jgi:hypothetical protein